MSLENTETTDDVQNSVTDEQVSIPSDDTDVVSDADNADDQENSKTVITYDGESLDDDDDSEDDSDDELDEESDTDNDEAPESINTGKPSLIKKLRVANRTQAKELKRLKREAEAAQVKQEEGKAYIAEPELKAPIKPTYEGCDYDDKKFDDKNAEYIEKEVAYKLRLQERNEKLGVAVGRYNERRNNLGVVDYQVAHDVVAGSLSVDKQDMILLHAEKPELVVYAIGKNPNLLKELRAASPVQFAYKMAQIEAKTMTTQRTKPKPRVERKVSATGGGSLSDNGQKHTQALLKKAQQTGDFTAYAKSLKQK